MKKVFTIMTALVLSTSVNAATVIDTTSSWGGASIIGFGESDATTSGLAFGATYGQVFTVGSSNQLNSFTYLIDDYLNPNPVDFEAFVLAWDGAKATGSILYQSSSMTTTNNAGAGGFESFTVNTGGLNLTSGNQYVAFFSASNLFDGITGLSQWAFTNDVYSGGDFVFFDNGDDFSLLTTSNWDQLGNYDLAFSMNFTSPVPEPSTYFLMLGGLGLIGFMAYRRKKIQKK